MAADSADAALDSHFRDSVRPFLDTYCITCHSKDKTKGDVDLSPYSTVDSVVHDIQRWETVLEKLSAAEMPPKKAKQHPTPKTRQQVIDWIVAMRKHEAQLHAGDPGIVLARRLSNSEYDYTIRDLTGVDIHPAKEFPVDPANEAGFDNTGESLAMSPSLVKKYLEAARFISEHLVVTPHGIEFAPFPIVADTDRDRYCVNRIVEFYKRQPTDLTQYFFAAWQYRNRASLGTPSATLADIAAKARISERYLSTVWAALTEAREDVGPVAGLQRLFAQLPSEGPDAQNDARQSCRQMRDWVAALREKIQPQIPNLNIRPVNAGSQSMVLWRDRLHASYRMSYTGGALALSPKDLPEGLAAAPVMEIPSDPTARERYEAAFARFCEIFPDAIFVTERARDFMGSAKANEAEKKNNAGRLLSAGFHSQMGYFRDDLPLYQLVLDEKGQYEIDELWRELDFVTAAPLRQQLQFLWYERAESGFIRDPAFDFARAEDNDGTSEPKLARLASVYVNKVRERGNDDLSIEVVKDFFDRANLNIRRVEHDWQAAEPAHLAALQAFAERAYRRPLSQRERDGVLAFYRALRKEDGLDHEGAMRDSIVAILMSPYFCYRADPRPPVEGVTALSDYALAGRLSYFLWSSMPDGELLSRAAAGDLHRPDVLLAQAHRMLKDDRVRGFATEFAGNWLDFRRFEEHNAVDRERFPQFDNQLRSAMFEEPIRFFLDVLKNDRPVTNFLDADYTFVNPVLAKHYGMPISSTVADEWTRVDHASQYGRGGLLPMAVFLTKNAPGLRTSPVKRGYWVVVRLLGERIAPPPPNVPVLPTDESKLGDLTLRQVLEKHREGSSCATCHVHFDSVGLVFEGYGPVGERRALDLGGRPVDTRATFPDGSDGAGLDGLRAYLHTRRQNDFLDNLCRKLLSYALGRTLMLSDDVTIEQMRSKLASNDNRFDVLIDAIITSPEFLTQRGRGQLAKVNSVSGHE